MTAIDHRNVTESTVASWMQRTMKGEKKFTLIRWDYGNGEIGYTLKIDGCGEKEISQSVADQMLAKQMEGKR